MSVPAKFSKAVFIVIYSACLLFIALLAIIFLGYAIERFIFGPDHQTSVKEAILAGILHLFFFVFFAGALFFGLRVFIKKKNNR